MKKFVKIIVIFLIFGVIGVAIYMAKKKAKDKKDRAILNGMTGDEFLKSIRPAWENKFIQGQVSWLKNQKEYSYNYLVESGQFSTVMDPELKKWVDETTLSSAKGSWETLNPNPLDFDWARLHWLPNEIESMGLNINQERVQELIKKI